MTTFLLIRHAHTDWIGKGLAGRLPGVHLSEQGRGEAEALVGRISRCQIDAIYSGPLQRTQETAEPLSKARGLEVQIGLRLVEIDFGKWVGRTIADLENDPVWKRFNTLRSVTRAPGGELMLEVQARMVDELEALRQAHPEQTVAVFSHQDTIKAAVAHCLGVPVDHFMRFQIDPASVTVLQMAEWGPRLVTLNHNGTL